VTFSEHLLEVRIRKAIELLSHPRATVTGAGYEVGFRDPSYFSRIFKRYAGITPSEYRDRYVRKDRRKADAAQQTSSAYGRADTVEDDALVEAEVKPAGKLRR
jgi:AraC-like DNA-binding protein